MKKIASFMVVALLVMAAQAQTATEKPQEKFRIKLVENKNGKETVIDRTFASREEMVEFIRDNNLDLPEPPQPPVPPTSPVAPAPPHDGKCNKEKICNKRCEKIIIIEDDDEDSKEEKTEMKRITNELPVEERAEIEREIEKELAGAKGGEVKVIIIKKEAGDKGVTKKEIKTEAVVNETTAEAKNGGHKRVIIEEGPQNLSRLKLYPNPSKGEFKLEFNLEKPSDVKLRITDLNGKEVYSETLKNFSGRFEKNISRNLPAGTYVLDVEAGGEKESTRVEVQ